VIYPIPSDYDLGPFVGCELNSMTIGCHHVELTLMRTPHVINGVGRKDGCGIVIESGFVLRQVAGAIISCGNETLRYGAGHLVCLIEHSITGVEKLQGQGLSFVFSNGAHLELLAPEDGYESFHLHTPAGSIDV